MSPVKTTDMMQAGGSRRDRSVARTGISGPNAKSSFYKPELDILRFFAFLGVFASHIADYPVAYLVNRHVPVWAAKVGMGFVHAGAYGVDLFFVLSAYLITELLLREKDELGSLHLKAFYMRRILRIWPLYYLFVPLAAVVPFLNPNHQFGLYQVLSFLFLLGNWSFVFFGSPPGAGSVAVPLWSVSVEEQFYLLWPPVVSRLSRRQIAMTAIGLILAANISRLLEVSAGESTQQLWVNTFAHLDSIAAGVLLAVWPATRLHLRYGTRVALWAAGVSCLAMRGHLVAIVATERPSFVGTLVGYPAVVVACTAMLVAFMGLPVRLPVFQYLGRISYGLYVYHMMCIVITDRVMPQGSGPWHAGLRVALALAITITIAAVSYTVLERPFLKLKRRFTHIESRLV